jgi:hypothetical protein
MSEAFRLGGWGMYPTMLAGLVLVTVAIRYAVAPDPRRRALVRSLAMLVFLTSCLGFVSGSIRSLISGAQMAASDAGNLIAQGIGESLENIGLGLALLVMAAIATAIGTSRAGAEPAKSPLGGAELHGL